MASNDHEGMGVIAVDGPAGAGKSTVARLVAARLGYLYLDTGAMYRGIALAALRAGVALADAAALARLAREVELDIRLGGDGQPRVFLGGEDVSAQIREPAVDQVVATVSSVPAVREALVARQRLFASRGRVVVDGRDIGSAVLPRAEHKFFVTADLAVRVQRRLDQLRQRGFRVTRGEVEHDIVERDRLDSGRSVGPLVRAADAILIDTTTLSVDEAVGRILAALGCTGAAL